MSIEKINTFHDKYCTEYDIIINEKKVAYAIEYVDNSAEIYYDFDFDDVHFEDPLSSYVFDSIEDLNEFVYRMFEQ